MNNLRFSRLSFVTLLHQSADGEPERIADGEAILEIVVLRVARIRIAPFVGRTSSDQQENEAHGEHGSERVDLGRRISKRREGRCKDASYPDLQRQRTEKTE